MAKTPGERIDVLRNRIHTSEEIIDEDAEALIDFSDQLYPDVSSVPDALRAAARDTLRRNCHDE